MNSTVIDSPEAMARAVDRFGLLPFFQNNIPGFSISQMTPDELWFSDERDGPWEWKDRVIKMSGCAYGKFFDGKAGFISREVYPLFADYRRDGYDFDARFADGLASIKEKQLYETLDGYENLLSKDLKSLAGYGKGGKKGFDGTLTRLMMRGYIITCAFEKRRDKTGREYGWAIGRYTTPEKYFGRYFAENVYRLEPRRAKEQVYSRMLKLLPGAKAADIDKLMGFKI